MYFRFFAAFLALSFSASLAHADDIIWIDGKNLTARAEALLKILKASGDHGLDPRWYGVAEIEKADTRTEKMPG